MAKEVAITIFSGRDLTLKFTIDDEDTPPNFKDLTGAQDIVFAVSKAAGKPPLFSLSLTANPGQVTVTAPPTGGKFEVALTAVNTEPFKIRSHKYYECCVTDAAGKSATVTFGDTTIKENTIQK